MIPTRLMPMGRGGKRLPYDAEVEYLESTGTQWIDTGIEGRSASKIRLVAKSVDTDKKSTGVACGCGTAGGTDRIQFYAGRLISPYWSCRDDGTIIQSSAASVYDITDITLDRENKECSFDLEHFTYSTSTNVTTRAILLFALRENVASAFIGRIYACQIWQHGTLVRDFVPVRVGTVGYLYDRVSGQLFGNQGTGAFVVGADK